MHPIIAARIHKEALRWREESRAHYIFILEMFIIGISKSEHCRQNKKRVLAN